jgi:sugar-specific transcriptional regulator TrmB
LDDRAQRLLMQYGLSERESVVYLSLLAHGQQSAGEIARAVDIRRMEAYRTVKRLADVGVVVATPGNPVRYSAEPIEQVVAMMMDVQMKKLDEMEKGRAEVVQLGRTMSAPPTKRPEEYSFKMVQGREQIYAHVMRMVQGTSKALDMVLSRNDLLQLHLLGLAEALKEAKRRGVVARLISVCDHQTTEAAEGVLRAAELRHSDDFEKSRIVMADKAQVLMSLVLDDIVGRKNDKDVAIWTNSGDYARTMVPLFEKAFAVSAEARERLRDLRTGRKAEERAKAMLDILKVSLPLEGWSVQAPARLKGVSGNEYEVGALLSNQGRSYAVEVVMGNDEASSREPMIAAIMKGIEIKSPPLVVIGSPYTGDELGRLASLVGVVLIDGADPVSAATRLRREIA